MSSLTDFHGSGGETLDVVLLVHTTSRISRMRHAAPGDANLLIIRHGFYRGRGPDYLNGAFERLCRTRPAIAARLRFHATGSPSPSLDGVGALVFFLADPLREQYPDCYTEAAALASRARAQGLAVINPPDALSNTIKSVQSRLWSEAEIPTADVRRYTSKQELHSAIPSLDYPVLIGADEQQGPRHLHVCKRAADVKKIPDAALSFPAAVAQLVDVRREFRSAAPGSIWARYYHKRRVLVLGERVRTKHIFFSNRPVVTTETCKFRLFKDRMGWLEWMSRVAPRSRALVEADVEFWRRGSEHQALMCRAVKTLGLDYAAIDYSNLPDGRLVLWEANPFPSIPTAQDIMLPRRRRAHERVASYYDAFGDFFADILHGVPHATPEHRARRREA